ncbi:MAG: hypothetical protein ABIV47_06315 [Roseiflexaceae bacterium]
MTKGERRKSRAGIRRSSFVVRLSSAHSHSLTHGRGNLGRQQLDALRDLGKWLTADINLPDITRIAEQFVQLKNQLPWLGC